MDNDGTIQNHGQGQEAVVEHHPDVAVIGDERREITGMLRVGYVVRVIVGSCLAKVIGTIAVLMKVEGKECRSVFIHPVRQVGYFRCNKNTGFRKSVELYQTIDVRICGVSF